MLARLSAAAALAAAATVATPLWLVPSAHTCGTVLVRVEADAHAPRAVDFVPLRAKGGKAQPPDWDLSMETLFEGAPPAGVDAKGPATAGGVLTAELTGMKPGQQYALRAPGLHKSGRYSTFFVPQCSGAEAPRGAVAHGGRLLLLGDPGQTDSSRLVLRAAGVALEGEHLMQPAGPGLRGFYDEPVGYTKPALTDTQRVPSALVILGDASYADGEAARWPSWSAVLSPLASRVPVRTVVGNHDVYTPLDTQAYLARYGEGPRAGGPPVSPKPSVKPADVCAGLALRAVPAVYYSFEVGPMFVLALSTYTTDARGAQGGPERPFTGYAGVAVESPWAGDAQASFIRDSLACVDRTRTPFVIVAAHGPWAGNSNVEHQNEALDALRLAWWPHLFEGGVDAIVAGHVHTVELSSGIGLHGQPDRYGPSWAIVGHSGNREGIYHSFQQPAPAWSVWRDTPAHGFATVDALPGNNTHFAIRVYVVDAASPAGPKPGATAESIVQPRLLVEHVVASQSWLRGVDTAGKLVPLPSGFATDEAQSAAGALAGAGLALLAVAAIGRFARQAVLVRRARARAAAAEPRTVAAYSDDASADASRVVVADEDAPFTAAIAPAAVKRADAEEAEDAPMLHAATAANAGGLLNVVAVKLSASQSPALAPGASV